MVLETARVLAEKILISDAEVTAKSCARADGEKWIDVMLEYSWISSGEAKVRQYRCSGVVDEGSVGSLVGWSRCTGAAILSMRLSCEESENFVAEKFGEML